ncbi:MAG: secretion protein HlyD, partial [Telluria sp.]
MLYTALGAAASGCSDKPADFYSGYVEADYVRLSSPVGGTLVRLFVGRGDTLARGAPAFVLEQD